MRNECDFGEELAVDLRWSDSDRKEYVPLRLDRRFHLRTALMMLSLLCCLFAVSGFLIRWHFTQEWAYAEIARRGGNIFVEGQRVRITFQEVPPEATKRCGCRLIRAWNDSVEFTDDDIHLLASVSGLANVELSGSRVTCVGVVRLHRRAPNCQAEINGDYPWDAYWSTWARC